MCYAASNAKHFQIYSKIKTFPDGATLVAAVVKSCLSGLRHVVNRVINVTIRVVFEPCDVLLSLTKFCGSSSNR